MAKVLITPQFGTVDDSKSVSFTIEGILASSFRVRVENASDKIPAIIKDYVQSGDHCSGKLDLRISSKTANTAFSLFFVVETPLEDGKWKINDIYPAIFYLVEIKTAFNGKIHINPLFIGPSDICSVKVDGKPNSKTILSINNKNLPVHTNNSGVGSIHFKGSDIFLSHLKNSVERIPVYYYTEDDNYTKKKFSGAYLTSLPKTISTHADIDPRCDPNDPAYVSPGTWTPDAACEGDQGGGGDGGGGGVHIEPTVPPTCLPTSCKTSPSFIDPTVVDRIHSHDAVVLNNGSVAHVYTSIDKSVTDPDNSYYNKTKVLLYINPSSLDSKVITVQDVVIAPKSGSENYIIYVNEDLYNALAELDNVSSSDIKVMFYDSAIGYQCFEVLERSINEYTGEYLLTASSENTNVEIKGWMLCVNAVFFHESEDHTNTSGSIYNYLSINLFPSVASEGHVGSFATDEDFGYLQILNISIASNSSDISEEDGTYLYLIVEGFVNGYSQLFFCSKHVYYVNGILQNDSGFSQWKQLTTQGNNRNPKSYVDKSNTLHIFWESDRSGYNQVYYGVLGLSSESSGIMAFSSMVDNYAEFYEKESKSFAYTNDQLLIVDTNTSIPEYTIDQLVSNTWITQEDGSGSVVETPGDYLNNLQISLSDTIKDEAMAFSRMQIQSDLDNPSDTIASPYDQFNFQVSFNISATITQPSSLMSGWNGFVLTDEDVDNIYDNWKTEFELSIDEDVPGKPVYLQGGDRFLLGRQDHVYDRVVPFFGSYRAEDSIDNPSDLFQINILKSETNLKDFVFGMMLEKSYFESLNLSTNEKEIHKIYTGRSKFVALIKTEDESSGSNYFIVREFPKEIDITVSQSLTFLLGYTKVESDEVVNMLDKYSGSYSSRYAGMIVFFIDNIPKFSHGFVSELSDTYNYFDLGFGVPSGGYYSSDKMLLSKLTTFDDLGISLTYSNISITSPTYTYNTDLVNLPDTIKNLSKLKVLPEEDLVPNPSDMDICDNSFDRYLLGFRGTDKTIFWTSEGENGGIYLYGSPGETDWGVDGVNVKEYDVSDVDKIVIEYSPTLHGSGFSRILIEVVGGSSLYDSGYIDRLTAITSEYWRDELEGLLVTLDVSSYSSIRITLSSDPFYEEHYYHAYFIRTYSSNNFLQIPLTFDGINQSVNVDGGSCNDMHIVWEGNKEYYWNIYTTNSVDKLRPFRFDTQVTDTQSHSIMPDISVNRNGKRMIVWHDDRDGKYNVYAARSLTGYSCTSEFCKTRMADSFSDYILQCSLSDTYTPDADGTYNFQFDLYTDNTMTHLYKTISSVDNETNWYMNGASLTVGGETLVTGTEVTISYTPVNTDNIFDMVLYIKLSAI